MKDSLRKKNLPPFSSIFGLNKYMRNSLSEEVNEEEEAPDEFFLCGLSDPFLFIS